MTPETLAVKEIVRANATAVYKDSLQPSIRVLGKPLAQCVSLFATPVGRMAEIFEKNIQRYIDKLDNLSEKDIVAPNTRVLVPILEKMRFIDDEKVAEYYAEILATASKKEHANKVMVTFIEILDRLTADEIKILEYVNSPLNEVEAPELDESEAANHGLSKGDKLFNISGSFPVLDIKRQTESQTGYIMLRRNFNNLIDLVSLSTPENIDSYIDNMISLGLIERKHSWRFAVKKIYFNLENHPIILQMKEEEQRNSKIKINLEQGRIDITNLGLKLLSLCSQN